MQPLLVARLLWTIALAVLALLAVFRAPIGALWMPAIGATEGGYLLAFFTLPLFVGAKTPFELALGGIGAVCVLLFLSPLARAPSVARSLPQALSAAFGPAPPGRRQDAQPPFSALRLLSFSNPSVPVQTHTYTTREGEPLRLDLYGTARAGARRPLVVVVHGGSWSGGDRQQLPAINLRLAHSGYAVAAIDYRLAPAHPFPAALDDLRAAVDYLRERADELALDPDRVVLYGRSAGGHLALLAAYRWREPFVRGVVSLYGPTDLRWSWAHPSNPLVLDTPDTLRKFLGGGPDDSPEMTQRYIDASPLEWVHADAPPTLLIHGGRDELVNPRQSARLGARLAEAGVAHVEVSLPWATHACEASLAGPSGQLHEYALRYFLRSPTLRGE